MIYPRGEGEEEAVKITVLSGHNIVELPTYVNGAHGEDTIDTISEKHYSHILSVHKDMAAKISHLYV